MNYYPIVIFFGTLPSLIWLIFYLRKDIRPEPKSMVLKIFFLGMLSCLPAIFFEMATFKILSILNLFFLNIIFVSLIEEFLKFLVVKQMVLSDPEFDEPVDSMIYMIISALGFAAGENILLLLPIKEGFFLQVFGQILGISTLRFLGATFLHALSSGLVGLFIGLSLRPRKKIWRIIFFGLFLAIVLHSFYNFSIIRFEGIIRIFSITISLILTAIFISLGFNKLKK